jgi:hypothetical protein
MEGVMKVATTMLFAASAVLAGCQSWGPTWSEVTGARFHRTTLHRMPAIIERVDDRGSFSEPRGSPIRMEPGRRVLQLQGVPPSPGWQGGGTLQVFVLNAEPCKRYYVNAQFENSLAFSRWTPVIDEVEPIAGCTVPAR